MRLNRTVLSALFFVSGTAGLMYEVVWVRMLVLVFGNTTHSVVAVVSAFLGGLALGSLLFGAKADGRNPAALLRLYARLELLVGVTAVIATLLLPSVGPLYRLLGSGTEVTFGVLAFKFICSVGLLLIPTAFMGATLPVLVAYFTTRYRGMLDRTVAWLYAINTFGAVLGVALTGFVLLELAGLRATAFIAASLNLLVAAAARFLPLADEELGRSTDIEDADDDQLPHPAFVVPALFLSGFAAIGYQILWTRALTPTTGTFVYAFSLILLLYLLGIALGSMLYAFVLRRVVSRGLSFSLSQAGIGFCAMGSVYLTSIHADLPKAVLVLGVILPATLCMGVSFPAGIGLLRGGHRAGKTVGIAYFSNTLGSIIGGFVAGFVLIPVVGSTQAIVLLSLWSLALALSFAWVGRTKAPGALASLYGLGMFALFGFDAWVFVAKRAGLYEASTERRLLTAQAQGYPHRFVEDEVASVFAYNDPRTGEQNLFVDGVPITNIGPETRLMAHLPLALHPDPKSIAVICFGMGSTFRSALLHDITVDAVELSRAVAGMFPLFFTDAETVLANKRGDVIINDGRNHIRVTDERYDVVTIDPPPPFNAAGTTVLYSQDFYEQISATLNPGGIVSQWLYFGSRADDVAMAVRSFVDVFPYVLVYRTPGTVEGIYLIGSHSRIVPDDRRIRNIFGSAKVRADFNGVGKIVTARDIARMYVGDGSDMRRFSAAFPPVTDDRPRTEYFLLRHAFRNYPPMTMDILESSFK